MHRNNRTGLNRYMAGYKEHLSPLFRPVDVLLNLSGESVTGELILLIHGIIYGVHAFHDVFVKVSVFVQEFDALPIV